MTENAVLLTCNFIPIRKTVFRTVGPKAESLEFLGMNLALCVLCFSALNFPVRKYSCFCPTFLVFTLLVGFCDALAHRAGPSLSADSRGSRLLGRVVYLSASLPFFLGIDPINVSGNCFEKHCSPNASESPFPTLGSTHQ